MLTILQSCISVMMEDLGMAIDMCFRDGAMRPPPGPLPNEPLQEIHGFVPLCEEEEEEMVVESEVHLELQALKREMCAMHKAMRKKDRESQCSG